LAFPAVRFGPVKVHSSADPRADIELAAGRSTSQSPQAHAYELQEIPANDLRRVRSAGIPEANLRRVRIRPPIARGRQVAIASNPDARVSFNLVDFYNNQSRLFGVDSLKITFEEAGESFGAASMPSLPKRATSGA
jgi:hypothetical protein